ncbi:hypothetical protein, partial [Arsenicibacter rosenii]|uniref:hypothetical protein n=1 Tax=Arsenicibacter rosenii TaxID=1750698 RepID=UPI001160D3CC
MIELLFAGAWALNQTYHDRMAAIVLSRLQQGKQPFEVRTEDRIEPYLVEANLTGKDDRGKDSFGADKSAAVPGYNNLSKVGTKSGQVVVIPIIGAMSRYGGMCSWGSEDIA